MLVPGNPAVRKTKYDSESKIDAIRTLLSFLLLTLAVQDKTFFLAGE